MLVTVRRTHTQNKDRFRCRYKITTPNIVIDRGYDLTIWKKFLAGQMEITAEAWYGPDQKLIIGKVVTKEKDVI